MWFEDLSPYAYGHLARDTAAAAALNVGWLEKGRPFPTGALPPEAVARLGELVAFGATHVTRGQHFCDLCPPIDGSRAWGDAEIRVMGVDGVSYAAPTLIHHYVMVHAYRPPDRSSRRSRALPIFAVHDR